MSTKTSRLSLDHFCTSVMEIFGLEYLRKPMMTDVVKLYRHHEEKHGFPGMLRSLDCFLWCCWVEQQHQRFTSIPLFNDLKTGQAPEIPFVSNNVTYPLGYYVFDGIYPELATLVKTIPEPSDDDYKRIRYKKMQESERKDVKRAFGVLKKNWAILANPA
ncbi:RNA-directed DNA polymerase, eukaryota [Tanacetum coccineum]